MYESVHPEYGNIYPDEFIHVLEESGQILELDAFIWERACQYIRKWQDAGYRMPLSINLSRKDVHGHGLPVKIVYMEEGVISRPDRTGSGIYAGQKTERAELSAV